MSNYKYLNDLVSKKELRKLLAWSFTNYDCMQACSLADELKSLGFKYASKAGISISIEDLKTPFLKNLLIEKANQDLLVIEKLYFQGKFTDIEKLQKIINTWSSTSESLKKQIVYYFKNYDPLNSVYIMAFSGARGNLSQVRQLVGMRGLMADPSGQILNLPIRRNFREGLTLTDYLISGYGARKGIIDTALKTANSGYLTRRLIDVSQDILIRDRDCFTYHSLLVSTFDNKMIGRILNKTIIDPLTKSVLITSNTQLTSTLLKKLKKKKIQKYYIRSPLVCDLYRAICQQCYGWDLSNESLVDMGEAIGILAGQSIGEPGTQLTMRTFHTGGVFNAKTRTQIISPINGVIRFYKTLKTSTLRTNRGENVIIIETSGSLILIPDNNEQKLLKIDVSRNTILFPKNNQYILKDTVIGEVLNMNTEIRTEIKPILSENGGEIFIPKLKTRVNILYRNKLIWILFGQFYNSPNNSFLNFSCDYKVNINDSVFRTKLINHYSGFGYFKNSTSISYPIIQLVSKQYFLTNSTIKELKINQKFKYHILNFNSIVYLMKTSKKNLKVYLHSSLNQRVGILALQAFRTLTGGHLYYDYYVLGIENRRFNYLNTYVGVQTNVHKLFTFKESRILKIKEFFPFKSFYRTLIWLHEEIHTIDYQNKNLFIKVGDFISENFELVSGIFSNISGLISYDDPKNNNENKDIATQKTKPTKDKDKDKDKDDTTQLISIKPGILYQGKKLKDMKITLCYPGENIYSNISIFSFYFAEQISEQNINQILFRPIEIYEFPFSTFFESTFINNCSSLFSLKLEKKAVYSYKSNQLIQNINGLNLIKSLLLLKNDNLTTAKTAIQLTSSYKKDVLTLLKIQLFSFRNYLLSNLRYKNIKPCFLLQKNQFINCYSSLGYLEATTLISLEIIKIKVKNHKNKQILIISNNDCFVVKKNKLKNKNINDYIIRAQTTNQIGKIIGENGASFIVQKGKLYFFPNCKNENTSKDSITSNIEYKRITNYISNNNYSNRSQLISINTYNSFDFSIIDSHLNLYELIQVENLEKNCEFNKIELSRFFLKNNGRLYSCLVPQFIKNFTITNEISSSLFQDLFNPFNESIDARQAYFQYSDLEINKLSKQAQLLFDSIEESKFSNIQNPIRKQLELEDQKRLNESLEDELSENELLENESLEDENENENDLKWDEVTEKRVRRFHQRFIIENPTMKQDLFFLNSPEKFLTKKQQKRKEKKETKRYEKLLNLTPDKIKETKKKEKKKKPKLKTKSILKPVYQNLLIQSPEIFSNKIKFNSKFNYQLTFVKCTEYPFTELTKSIGLYSITEDYFEQDGNNIFCENFEFIESGKTIGLLNLEKEITGDIVQGLPKIEEILEARKKNLLTKRIPTSQKKKLLTQKSTLDPNFDFKKLGLTIQETDKINPHKLLKVYFNYYGLIKLFLSDQTKLVYSGRLINNYEGSYKSFKKVQLLILNAVQSVYKSQGVNINDKHLEIVIKQMTTKVRITDSGNTPLLQHEVLDLYHIHHINKVIRIENKKKADYVPLLLGITKAALNNPSFISAASFQETTRILTKAAIEGRIDWLRGLKENIITGRLITAGTGHPNYRFCFASSSINKKQFTNIIDKFK